jgi:amino acid permease
MLEPIVDTLSQPPEGKGGGPTVARNIAMLFVVLCVTPLCTLRNLTALRNVGAASMVSVLTVGLIVAYRSIECQLSLGGSGENEGNDQTHTNNSMKAFPPSTKQLLDAVPLFISSYICHFNVLPIHNELRCPTSDRVKQWVRTTIWPATLFYWLIGFTGSLYAKCTPSGSVQGNILLDFEEDDPLLLLGRLCLAMTITLALPMLVIPARDILVRSVIRTRVGSGLLRFMSPKLRQQMHQHPSGILTTSASPHEPTTVVFEPMEISQIDTLEEPLLVLDNRSMASTIQDELLEDSDLVEDMSMMHDAPSGPVNSVNRRLPSDGTDSKLARSVGALFVFWSAAFLACSVESIDVVWDLLGSSFSIMMAFLIPAGCFLKLARRKRFDEIQDGGSGFRIWMISRLVAWMMILVFVPLMVVSTMNAVYNSLFSKGG